MSELKIVIPMEAARFLYWAEQADPTMLLGGETARDAFESLCKAMHLSPERSDIS